MASSLRNATSFESLFYTICLPWHSRFEHWAGFHQSPLWQWQMLHSSTFTSMPAGIMVVPAKQFGPGTHTYIDQLIKSERLSFSRPSPLVIKIQPPKPWMNRSHHSYQLIIKEFSSHLHKGKLSTLLSFCTQVIFSMCISLFVFCFKRSSAQKMLLSITEYMQFSEVLRITLYLLYIWGCKACRSVPWNSSRGLTWSVSGDVPSGLSPRFLWWVWDNELAHSSFSTTPSQFLESPACFLITMNNSWPDDLFISQTSFVRGSFDFYKWSSFNLLAISFFFFFLRMTQMAGFWKWAGILFYFFRFRKALLKNVVACSL